MGFVTLARVDHKLFTLAGVDSQKRGNSNFFYSGGGGGEIVHTLASSMHTLYTRAWKTRGRRVERGVAKQNV